MVRAMLEIYGYLKDPFAWRVRFTAEEKGVAYEWLPGDISFPDARVAKNNPTMRSPLAIHDGFVLADGFNIQLYIDEAFPGRPLQTETPRGRAEVRMFVASLDALVVVLAAEGGRATFNRRAFKRMDEVFASIDQQLQTSATPWLDGERPGHRDISFLPLLSGLEALETTFPATLEALTAYWQRAMAYEPFQKTNPRSMVFQGKR
jgi:glutathione S-transferase